MNTVEASARQMLDDHVDGKYFNIRDYPRGYDARVWLHEHALEPEVQRWLACPLDGTRGIRFFTADPEAIRADVARLRGKDGKCRTINPASLQHGLALADMLESRAQEQ